MKILIDTNIYLDFYRSNKEGIILLTELIAQDEVIILTDQIIQEFERSREKVIRAVLRSFEQESKLENFSSSLLNDMEAFKELIEIQKSYKAKKIEVNKLITEILEDPTKDKIAVFFKELVNKSIEKDRVLYTDDEIIKNAHTRKLIGNPPTTLDKYSIGDEINWEIVLKNLDEDIIIVGRDNTFNDNFSFLKKDFHKRTGHELIGVTEKITDALTAVGIRPTDELEAAEEKLIESIENSHYSEFWKRSVKDEELG
jgi:hypothetical protein